MNKKKDNKEIDENLEKQIIELRKKGYSRNKISKELHIDNNKTQKVLEKHNLSGKKGYDLRKIPKKKIIGKKRIEKPKKEKVKEIKRKKVKRKEKPFRLYGLCKYQGYKDLYYYKGYFGTKWYLCNNKNEIPDIMLKIRHKLMDEIYLLENSLTSLSYKISYIKVEKIKGKLVKTKIGEEKL